MFAETSPKCSKIHWPRPVAGATAKVRIDTADGPLLVEAPVTRFHLTKVKARPGNSNRKTAGWGQNERGGDFGASQFKAKKEKPAAEETKEKKK
jgi:hypothetical protein